MIERPDPILALRHSRDLAKILDFQPMQMGTMRPVLR